MGLRQLAILSVAASTRAIRVCTPLACAATAAVLATHPASAEASDLEDFRAARALYDAHDWAGAATALESLVGGETPRLRNPELVTEARKYLAAAYVFLGREGAARATFERLLQDEPSYALDEALFPREVVALFTQVRTQLMERRDAEARHRALEAELAQARAENQALQAELARERSVEVPRSPWLVQIPFGVGQFENGEDGLGAFFLVTETLLVAALATSSSLQLAYASQVAGDPELARDAAVLEQLRSANATLEVVNWSSAGLLVGIAAAGVIQANLAFRPTRSLLVPGRASSSSTARLSVTPLSIGISVPF